MGMSMMHLVADPEPAGGDAQSFRGVVPGESPADVSGDGSIGPGRGVRVRSWKDHFRGWPFSDDPAVNKSAGPRKTYAATDYSGNLELKLRNDKSGSPRNVIHPDLTFADDALLNSGKKKKDAPLIDKLADLDPRHRLDGVWTPPAGIDLNGWGLFRYQSLDPSNRYANPGYSDLDAAAPSYGEGEHFAGAPYMYYGHSSLASPAGFQNDVHKVYQWGPTQTLDGRYNSFGQYAYRGQEAQYERRLVSPAVKDTYVNRKNRKAAVYKFGYNGKYTDMLYVRLSLLRPDSRVSNVPEKLSKEPVWGLYAIRAWDYQKAEMGMESTVDSYVYDFQDLDRIQEGTGILDNVGEARKRVLMVVQGLQLTYQPSRQTVKQRGNFKTPDEVRYIEPQPGGDDASLCLRAPKGGSSQHHGTKKDYEEYKKDRERVFGLHFWGNHRSKKSDGGNVPYDDNPNKHEINEIWIGEGFSPIEVAEILGLDRARFDPATEAGVKAIMNTYSTK
jgi:hypothetical protein